MKTAYVCEKCGAQFTESHDAYECERNHLTMSPLEDEHNDIIQTYLKGKNVPETITMYGETREWSPGDVPSTIRRTVAVYKLLSVDLSLSNKYTEEAQQRENTHHAELVQQAKDVKVMTARLVGAGVDTSETHGWYYGTKKLYEQTFGHIYDRNNPTDGLTLEDTEEAE